MRALAVPLREDRIVRYGRQILLKDVGGRGQERLLSVGVRVHGSGPTVDDAIAWLLAGGTPVELGQAREVHGFLSGAPLTELNPDAASSSAALVVEVLPLGRASTAPVQVVLGAGLAFRAADACAGCWERALALLVDGPGPAPLGSLAALVVQRLVLGLEPSVGLLQWAGTGFARSELRCARH